MPSTKSKKSTKKASRKKVKITVPSGRMHVQATFNNTLVTFTDNKNRVLAWSSAGSAGFKGARKSTAYAAQIAAQSAVEKVKDYKLQKVDVYVKGIGLGREAAVRALQNTDIYVNSIQDVTPVPHNGTRPRKPRRA